MKRWITPLLALALALSGATVALAQEGGSQSAAEPPAGSQAPNTVVRGNTTIEFQAAGKQGIDSEKLKSWGDFAAANPKIASALAEKPTLMDDAGYLKDHPELAGFFAAHPDIKDAMAANPGNFVAIPPRPGE